MAIFTPNLTSKLLLKSATDALSKQNGMVLELGCGSGWITGSLISTHGTGSHNYWLSDISEEAIESSKKSLIPPLKIENFEVGSRLNPWKGKQFNVIINDIAGISDEIAEASEWYKGVPFKAGLDGLDNTREVLEDISSFLSSEGVFVAPLISLSNVDTYRSLLNETFDEVMFENRKYWPRPDEILEDRVMIEQLRRDGQIVLEEKYSKLLAFTEICVCRKAKKRSVSILDRI